MSDSSPVVVDELRVKRGSFALDVPGWRLAPGEIVGLVGPIGAGKTTLLEALAGLRPVSGGLIRVFGLDPWRHPVEVRSALGFMSDDMSIFALRIEKLLRMVSAYYPTWDGAFAERLLARFELDPQAKSWQLSRGQGTRLRLVLALAFRPKVLLLDEPAAGLDLAGRRALLETVLDVVRDPERSVVVSSHMLDDVERIADRLLVLSKGVVVREGPADQLVGGGRTLEEALIAWGAV